MRLQGAALSWNWAGIPIRIQGSFWLMTLVIGSGTGQFTTALLWAGVVLASVLWHELGHALVARHFGQTVSIQLHAMGGTTSHRGPRALTPGSRAAISIAGPLFGFGPGALALLAQHQGLGAQTPLVSWTLAQLVWANLGYGALNLLPILPLDGGQLARAYFNRFAPRSARLATELLSILVSVLGLGLALTEPYRFRALLWILGWLLVQRASTFRESLQLIRDQQLAPQLTALGKEKDPPTIEKLSEALAHRVHARSYVLLVREAWSRALTARSEYRKALEVLLPIPEAAQTAQLRRLRAWIHLRLKEYGRALECLARDDAKEATALRERIFVVSTPPDQLLAALHAASPPVQAAAQEDVAAELFDAGRYAEALSVMEQGFGRTREAFWAVNAAFCLSQLGRLEEGISWLHQAMDAGFRDVERFDSEPDLAALRGHPDFAQIRAKASAPPRSGAR